VLVCDISLTVKINYCKVGWYQQMLFIFSALVIIISAQIMYSGRVGAYALKYGMDLHGGTCLTFAVKAEDMMSKINSDLESEVKSLVARQHLVVSVHSDDKGVHVAHVTDDAAPIVLSGMPINWIVTPERNGLLITYDSVSLDEKRAFLLNKVRTTIESRVDSGGTAGVSVYAKGDNSIVVEAPGEQNPEAFKARLGKTGRLLFRVLADDGDVVDGSMISSAQVVPYEGPMIGAGEQRPRYVVAVHMTREGAQAMRDATKNHIGSSMEIALEERDGMRTISQPVIRDQLGANFQITVASDEEAVELALVINSGALPVPLSATEESVVGASLGADSIRTGVKAACLAVMLVAMIMIGVYGWMGMIAVWALLINLGLLMIFMAISEFPLTLPGIGGIAVTAGTAVDANVLINENLRKLVAAGKEWDIAVEEGYARAFQTIMNSNLTTFIGAFITYWCGNGPIKGFAVTWSVGLAVSVLVTVFFTKRFMEVVDTTR
jgi:protein-export SecD/SecF family membrane protein